MLICLLHKNSKLYLTILKIHLKFIVLPLMRSKILVLKLQICLRAAGQVFRLTCDPQRSCSHCYKILLIYSDVLYSGCWKCPLEKLWLGSSRRWWHYDGILFKDTSTCGQEELGGKPLTLCLIDKCFTKWSTDTPIRAFKRMQTCGLPHHCAQLAALLKDVEHMLPTTVGFQVSVYFFNLLKKSV